MEATTKEKFNLDEIFMKVMGLIGKYGDNNPELNKDLVELADMIRDKKSDLKDISSALHEISSKL
ncbi:hypothetical protein [Bacillus tropicus]|uniref:hypothetical protein n=1 Tax=Bacillus tropicus TaxID=2026188 RepID=UPI0021CF5A37|nr:hypothetical protein [Bacillus tropicus]MCU5223989.1 hypothetical protein [Bacillus tropicus]